MNVSIIDNPPAQYTGKKHRWLYVEIEKLEAEKTLAIEFESVRELRRHEAAVRNIYQKELDIQKIELCTRKYGMNGTHTPTLYITRN